MSNQTFGIKRIPEGGYNDDGTVVEVTIETHEGPTLNLKARYFMLGQLIHALQGIATAARNIRASKGDLSSLETAVDLEAAGEWTTGVEILKDPNSTDVVLRLTRKSGALEHIRLNRGLAETLFSAMKHLNLQDLGGGGRA
jgi:hypothetical protein